MRKIELFENMPRLESSIQTIADAYRRTMREKNNLLDFSEVIIEQDVPTIAENLIQMGLDAFTISGFYDNLGLVLLAFQKSGFVIKCVITIKSGFRGTNDRTNRAMVPALLLVQKETEQFNISVKHDEPSENDFDDSPAMSSLDEELPLTREQSVEEPSQEYTEGISYPDDDKQEGKCRYCGKPIVSGIGRKRLFCSADCRRAWWKEHPEEGMPRNKSLKTINCAYCGKEFTTWGDHQRKYCSHECYIRARFGSKVRKRVPHIPPKDYW